MRGSSNSRPAATPDVNRLLDELATIALVQHDLTLQFRAAADPGDPARGLALLDKLDRHFSAP